MVKPVPFSNYQMQIWNNVWMAQKFTEHFSMWRLPTKHSSHIKSSSFHVSRERCVILRVPQPRVNSFMKLMSVYRGIGLSYFSLRKCISDDEIPIQIEHKFGSFECGSCGLHFHKFLMLKYYSKNFRML